MRRYARFHLKVVGREAVGKPLGCDGLGANVQSPIIGFYRHCWTPRSYGCPYARSNNVRPAQTPAGAQFFWSTRTS